MLFRLPTAAAAAVDRTFPILSHCFVFTVLVEVPDIVLNDAE